MICSGIIRFADHRSYICFMKTQLSKITDIPESGSVALLFNDITDIQYPLKKEELEFWSRKPDKAGSLLLQRLPHFVFLVNHDPSKPESLILETFRRAGSLWMKTVMSEKIEEVYLAGFSGSVYTKAFIEGFLLTGYSFSKYKKEKKNFLPSSMKILDNGLTGSDLEELTVISEAVGWVRDLVNEPLSAMNAVKLAEEIRDTCNRTGVKTEIFNRKEIEALKMGGLLAVNRGSIDPPTFTLLEWNPDDRINSQPVVLVGKGVVFDTGGLSLKPTQKSMDYMKSDMAGAATVAAVIFAVSRLKLPVQVVGLVPATDNRPDGNAITPGDIITMFDGTSVEVLNTDAEGRLLLADALSYAKRFNPLLVIDVATLTGAASIISGNQGIPAMSNTLDYLHRLKQSGDAVYERIIELPLWNEFADSLKSEIADMSNVGGREGQTIVAAKFLEHFTAYPWIHLDIAGTAFLFEKDKYRPKGGTGSSTRLLINFLKNFK